MPLYIKKALPIEAKEYSLGLEDGFDDIEEACKNGLDTKYYKSTISSHKVPYILTLEGKHYINEGDFIITGVDGERYPCKREIFLKTYTLVNL
ncbi:MAG: hypothetical protein N4A63_01360 [Vallitalea sp.]|jgi:hypothetical protein|nr:hypothetical protein [Vallitalea sp.]